MVCDQRLLLSCLLAIMINVIIMCLIQIGMVFLHAGVFVAAVLVGVTFVLYSKRRSVPFTPSVCVLVVYNVQLTSFCDCLKCK